MQAQNPDAFTHAVGQAQLALQHSDKRLARRWAEYAIRLDPEREESWLVMAAVAAPRASIAYIERALEINPASEKARQGMDWAVQRLKSSEDGTVVSRSIPLRKRQVAHFSRSRLRIFPWVMSVTAILLVAVLWFGSPWYMPLLNGDYQPVALAQGLAEKATFTPTNTATHTATLTPTLTPTPTQTQTPTDTPLPTVTPVNTLVSGLPGLPAGVGLNDFWVDVNLSRQEAYAYVGYDLQRTFIISTGTAAHPTVIGTYTIYVMYVYADMAGPGYYLPDVPYVMYFYRGYGLHGTYWHNNFGSPMSHGCINMRTSEAGWVFEHAHIGTVVNIHY